MRSMSPLARRAEDQMVFSPLPASPTVSRAPTDRAHISAVVLLLASVLLDAGCATLVLPRRRCATLLSRYYQPRSQSLQCRGDAHLLVLPEDRIDGLDQPRAKSAPLGAPAAVQMLLCAALTGWASGMLLLMSGFVRALLGTGLAVGGAKGTV